MGKRSRQFEEEERSISCKVCEEEIALDYYLDRGDLLICEECGSEYVIKSRNPVVLFLMDDGNDEYDDMYGDDYFDNEEYSGHGYD